METLSGLDATFLYIETPETPMHVGSLCLYELPPSLKGSFHKAVKAHIARRMHLAPIFSRKLEFMPLDLGHPKWTDVGKVNLSFHIRQVKEKMLTEQEAQEVAAGLHSQLLDRSQPLWEFHVFERIQRADGSLCGGIYSKIHHATLDGKAGTVLTNAIMDISATPRDVSPPPARSSSESQRPLKMSAMIGSVFSNSLTQYARLIKALPQAVKAFGGTVVKQSLSGSGTKKRAKSPIQLAPMTPFNVAITSERSFDTARLPFADCRLMAKAVGGSFNDIVLWICATALRAYLKKHGTLPKKSMLAAMPISLRAEGNQDLNTQASMTVVELGTQYANPMKRLQVIMASTAKVKTAIIDLKGMIPTDYPSLLAPWVVGGVAKAAFKAYSATGLSHRLPMMANLVISNVPGPQVPLYMAGAKMLTYHPMSIVVHGIALNITIQTYAGKVDFGVMADKQAVPHLDDLTHALVQAFDEARLLLTQTMPEASPNMAEKSVKPRVKAPATVAKATKSKGTASKATSLKGRLSAKTATVTPMATLVKKAAKA